MLRLDCIDDSSLYRGFKDNYMVKVMQPLLLLAVFAIIYGIGLGLAWLGVCMRRSGGKWLDSSYKSCGMVRFTRGDPKYAMDPTAMFSNYMAILQAFYISLCFISLQLFMCYEHPNGKDTLTFGPNVECNSADWQRMIGEALMILIPFVGGAAAALIFAAMVAPKFFAHKHFRTA